MARPRWPFFVLAVGFLFILATLPLDYRGAVRSVLRPEWQTSRDYHNEKWGQIGKANATFVVLARNSEIEQVVHSLWELEDSFNTNFHYPYVFLNDVPFTEEFKQRTRAVISSSAKYGLIPKEQWNQPDWIDEDRASASRKQMEEDHVDYGGSVSYRNMCRFYSGFFYRHELLLPYRYYWRIEPGVNFMCHVRQDPFKFMEEKGKLYGFTVALYEYPKTIPTLWNVTKEFIHQHPQYVPDDNSLGFISDDDGETYNKCHFWSNFEIGDMDLLWRSEAYTKYFDFLESKGGFYYERWGDAPVHSIAAALFTRKDQIHFFNDIGYRHSIFEHCPTGITHWKGQCKCMESNNFDYNWYSCKPRFDALFEKKHP